MASSLKLGSYGGIPVKIHWSFGFLLIFIGFIAYKDGLNLSQALGLFLYVIALFFCVVLHEFGHALTAKAYNIKTKDILLSPIGGLARMENFPDAPLKELLIALAGPAVNLALAIIGGLLIYLLGIGFEPPGDLLDFYSSFSGFIKLFVIMNAVLFFFNLIPAFPMDGGRVLRALLSFKFGKLTATRIASYLGQALAIGFFIYGFWNQHLVLPIIALFIYFVAAAERKQTEMQFRLIQTKAKEIMISQFDKIYPHNSLSQLRSRSNHTPLMSHLVFDINEKLIGSLPHAYLEESAQIPEYADVASLMTPKFAVVKAETNLEKIYHILQNQNLSVVAIETNGEIVGAIDRDLLKNWMLNKKPGPNPDQA